MSNLNYNQCVIGGRLVNDPELRQTQQGTPVTLFTVAVNRRTKVGEPQIADFMSCVAWNGTAEFISRYFRKASSIMITGEIRNREYENKEGVKQRTFEILVKEAAFVDSKREETAKRNEGYNNPSEEKSPEIGVQIPLTPQAPPTKENEVYGDSDIPF